MMNSCLPWSIDGFMFDFNSIDCLRGYSCSLMTTGKSCALVKGLTCIMFDVGLVDL